MGSRALKNGELVIFHTEPESQATVVGVDDDGYALLFAPHGTIEGVEVKKITREQLTQAHADQLLRFGDEFRPSFVDTPKKKKKKVKTKAKAPATVVPPWGK
jgi:hypothetical protein